MAGHSIATNRKYDLVLPKSKHYKIHAIKNGEQELRVTDIITQAVNRKKYKPAHIKPSTRKTYCEVVNLPRTLQKILTSHSYPLSQGPVLLPIEGRIDRGLGNEKTFSEVLRDKTMFSHSDSQNCYEWFPNIAGMSAWGQQSKYEVREMRFDLEGAASMRDMGLVYTCDKYKCTVHCPCTVCRDQSRKCKLWCRAEVCTECNSQCTEHSIKLARLFNADTDHFTMVTQKMDRFMFAHPYAGIPLGCAQCSQDVLEHQVYHLVFHLRCRFCRYEMRPFENKSVVDLYDYEQAELELKRVDNRTCSVCLQKCQDKFARKKHEEVVHEGKVKALKCDVCEKSYSNKNALSYHKLAKHEKDVTKYDCDLCGSQFTAEATLLRHKQTIHGESSKGSINECLMCERRFTRKDDLQRHNREQHFESNANVDFVEDLDTLTGIKCDQCGKLIKRRSNYERHCRNVHNGSVVQIDSFKCSQCDKTFQRKDNLNRHVKLKH